eukprot:1159833-Pelagomonas_calceolata.AAC.4
MATTALVVATKNDRGYGIMSVTNAIKRSHCTPYKPNQPATNMCESHALYLISFHAPCRSLTLPDYAHRGATGRPIRAIFPFRKQECLCVALQVSVGTLESMHLRELLSGCPVSQSMRWRDLLVVLSNLTSFFKPDPRIPRTFWRLPVLAHVAASFCRMLGLRTCGGILLHDACLFQRTCGNVLHPPAACWAPCLRGQRTKERCIPCFVVHGG